MVFKEEDLDCDKIVKEICQNELNILLVENGMGLLKNLAEHSTYQDKQGIFGNGTHISYYLYPVHYSSKFEDELEYSLTKCRHEVVWNIFDRWMKAGYNVRRAKTPWRSDGFTRYLGEIGFFEADYILLGVNN